MKKNRKGLFSYIKFLKAGNPENSMFQSIYTAKVFQVYIVIDIGRNPVFEALDLPGPGMAARKDLPRGCG
jgi:hypothetical protein